MGQLGDPRGFTRAAAVQSRGDRSRAESGLVKSPQGAEVPYMIGQKPSAHDVIALRSFV